MMMKTIGERMNIMRERKRNERRRRKTKGEKENGIWMIK